MSTGRILIGSILILIGLSSLTGFPIFNLVFPVLLIWLGWTILAGRRGWPDGPMHQHPQNINHNGDLNEVLLFSNTNKMIKSDDFKGGKIVCVFSSAKIDLSNVKSSEKVMRMEVVAVFAELKVRIPENWIVVSDVSAIAGAMENKTHPKKEKTVELHLNGSSVFGGIEISN